MKEEWQQLRHDLETLSMLSGRTIPEIVAGIKRDMTARGADMDIYSEFFGQLDATAALHIN